VLDTFETVHEAHKILAAHTHPTRDQAQVDLGAKLGRRTTPRPPAWLLGNGQDSDRGDDQGNRPITDEGLAVGGAFDSDPTVGMMPIAYSRRRRASVLAVVIVGGR
jgi:hypothetical protein